MKKLHSTIEYIEILYSRYILDIQLNPAKLLVLAIHIGCVKDDPPSLCTVTVALKIRSYLK